MMVLCFRTAHQEEKNKIIELWQHCFADPPAFADWYFTNYYQPQNTMIVEENGQILSALQLIPYTILLRGKPFSINYLVGMGTWEYARNRGLAKQLLTYSLAKMVTDRKEYYTMLLPAIPPFYAKMGWAYGYDLQQYAVPANPAPPVPYQKMTAAAGKKEIVFFADLYRQFCASYHGYTIRDNRNWQAILQDLSLENGHILFSAKAYLFYTKKEGGITITDCAFTSQTEFAFLLQKAKEEGLLSSFSSAIALPQLPTLEKPQPFMMGRVASVPFVLQSLSYAHHENGQIIWRIKDPLCPQNEQPYWMEIQYGKVQIKAIKNQTCHCLGPTITTIAENAIPLREQITIDTDIASFTALLLGYRSVQQLQQEGKIKGEKSVLAYAGQLFPPCQNYIHDYF